MPGIPARGPETPDILTLGSGPGAGGGVLGYRPELLRGLALEPELLYFPRAGERETAGNRSEPGRLEGGQAGPDILEQGRRVGGAPGGGLDERGHLFSPAVAGDAHDRGVRHVGVAEQGPSG